ncbi:hypothetical protein IWQ51_006248 [Labrenzia sp. EL_142]|nr:hypothetical protein [Labrenzia sp. EL_142]
MASLFDGIDTSDPCLVWPVLQTAYYKLAAGESEVRVKYQDFDVAVQPASLQELGALITRLKAECNRSQGIRTRFAMRGGF